jgi:uncharacterized protein (TIGR03067 family)
LKRFPVEQVSWDDAQLFLKELNKRDKQEGWVYRLPKEVEWAYACRGGPMSDRLESAFDFYFDKPVAQLLPDQANLAHGKGLKRTCKVGSYKPNRLGLYDMLGNVWEWCDDEVKDAKGASQRVLRGGCWLHDAGLCRASGRSSLWPSFRGGDVGLRLARVPVGKEIVKIAVEEKKPADPVARDLEKLQGDWLLIVYELNGEKMPEEKWKDTRSTITGDKHRIVSGTGDILEATIKLDPTKKPKAVDAAISLGGAYKGKTRLGIYEIEDDQVKFCMAQPGKERPESFTTRPGSGDSLGIWKRVKRAQPQGSKGFVPLFNGKDSIGWREIPGVNSGTWTVEDGVLVIKANEKQFSWFVTRRPYSNFHLFAEVMNIPGNNKAIAIRGSDPSANGKASNYSISLGGVAGGQNLPIGSCRKMPDLTPEKVNWQRPAFPVTVKPYAWFRMEIKAVGNKITVLVDGHKILEFADQGAFLRDGAITFWGVGPSEIRVRKLEIMELDAGDEGAVKPAEQGFMPLFGPLPNTFTNSLGMEFVLIPKGKSWLGGGGGNPGDKKVEIVHDFYLGKYEVTQEEWEKVMGSNPSHFKSVAGVSKEDQKRFPVENVSWEDAQAFIARVNEKGKAEGWVYRLPTELEWEYACRGGPMKDKFEGAFDFYFEKPTNTLLPDQANFEHGKGLKRTCKVGSYRPNQLGLHDMQGNVSEWCDDEVRDDKRASQRVHRGGAWFFDAGLCREPHSYANPPSYRNGGLGLRLARVPVGK